MNRNVFAKSMLVGAAALAVLTAFSAPASAQAALEVRIENVRPGGGQVRVALFDEANWLSDVRVASAQVDASGASVTVRLSAPRAGRYAVSVYQDLNRDGRLNRNLIGIPSEPWGASNDAPANFGPPQFSDAALDVGAQGARTTLRLR